ncbi:STAS domain-containing protein [Streptomyces sp. NBRC 110028]|uniref:STAS domain-containing protein n=1 Tax=Streptomyces sp. NBRC 110028 TaxID=1621260 RepID=UPI001F2496B6|nr:STAS domain-containing protein [Streptomyces sp. NBRC 110028]
MSQQGAPRGAPVPQGTSDATPGEAPVSGAAAGDLRLPGHPAPPPYARTSRVGGHIVVALHGEIDIAGLGCVGPALDAATGAGTPEVVVDLRPTTFFDCSGLGLLCRAQRRVADRGGRLRLVCDDPLILRTLRVGGLLDALGAVATLEEAVGEE